LHLDPAIGVLNARSVSTPEFFAFVVEGVQGTAGISFFFPQSLSATESVTMTASETQSTVGASGTITISNHFLKGKIVSYRTNAVGH
jgi:hypothetical protein